MERLPHMPTFRPLGIEDVELLAIWQSDPEVGRWWCAPGEDSDPEALRRTWTKRVLDQHPRVPGAPRRFVIEIDGRPVGEIQAYVPPADSPEAREIGESGGAIVDLLIGGADRRDRGLGRAALGLFVETLVWRIPGVRTCVADPHPDNTRAIACFAHAGFEFVRRYRSASTGTDVHLMRMERPADR
jgi:aminoglycoside 6'-N-acetyltransferase